MSWLFSRALVEDCSPPKFLDGAQSALWNWMNIADAFLSSDKMTDTYDPHSQYGMTFVPLTAERGVESLMSSLEVFLVKHLVQQQQGKIRQMIFGLKCEESWQMSLRGTYLPKMSQEKPLTQPVTILNRWVTKPKQLPLVRKTWVQTTYGKDFGYLHTPTTMANFCAPSMQKHAGCRNWVKVFGKVTPEAQEYLMGWPTGWTDLKPLVMGKFQLWRQWHG